MGQNFNVPYFTRQNYGQMYNEMESNSNISHNNNNNNSVNKLDDSNNMSEYSKNK